VGTLDGPQQGAVAAASVLGSLNRAPVKRVLLV
jgi:hypothetical protein